jgi:hypothetical protein
MITVTLTPELEQVIVECAEKLGTTPELYVLDELRMHHLPSNATPSMEADSRVDTMADFFSGYAGTIDSRESVPDGAHLSTGTGRKFGELMIQKHRAGKL